MLGVARSSSTTSTSLAQRTLATQPAIRYASSTARMAAVRVGLAATLVADFDPGAADAVVLEVDALVDQAAVEEEPIGRRSDHPIQVRTMIEADSADDGRFGARTELGAEAPAVRVLRTASLR